MLEVWCHLSPHVPLPASLLHVSAYAGRLGVAGKPDS